MNEKPIIKDNSRLTEALHKSMEKHGLTDNPYESDRHKEAQDYIKRRKIKVRPLRSEQ